MCESRRIVGEWNVIQCVIVGWNVNNDVLSVSEMWITMCWWWVKCESRRVGGEWNVNHDVLSVNEMWITVCCWRMKCESRCVVGGWWQGVKDVKKTALTVPESPAFLPRKTRSAALSSVSCYWIYGFLWTVYMLLHVVNCIYVALKYK